MVQGTFWDGGSFLRLQFSTSTSLQSLAVGIPLHSILGGPGRNCWALLMAMEFLLFENKLFCFLQVQPLPFIYLASEAGHGVCGDGACGLALSLVSLSSLFPSLLGKFGILFWILSFVHGWISRH